MTAESTKGGAFDVRALAARARAASVALANATTQQKNTALDAIARELRSSVEAIVAANQRDLAAAEQKGLSAAMVDRLRLTPDRIEGIAQGVAEIVALPDPIGRMSNVSRRPNGLEVGRMQIPLGVISMIYESRPNVTVDAGALTIKSGNAVVLKGGSEAIHSNRALIAACQRGLAEAGLPEASIAFVDSTERSSVMDLLQLSDLIDLVIPRGGEGLIRFVTRESKIPVVQHYKGVCHVFVDRDADLDQAVDIAMNSKVQRPGVCNALETLLIDEAVALPFLSAIAPKWREAGVEIRGDEAVVAAVPEARPASEQDWDEEYLDLILSVRVVSGLDEAISHIGRYGSGHTDAIVTERLGRAREFTRRVQSSCVVVNASTRFNDGNQLGLGAEIGISTSKLHAYGPMGLEELTTSKFVVMGEGQIRT